MDRKLPIFLTTILFTLTLFFLTLWRFGANQCSILIVLCVLLCRPLRQALFSRAYSMQPLFFSIYLLTAWAFIGVLYSEAPTYLQALKGLSSYTKLWFLFFFPIAIQSRKTSYWAEQGLILGVLINVILSLLNYFKISWVLHFFGPYFQGPTFAINPLPFIVVEVLGIWLLANRFVDKSWRWHDVLIFIILVGYLWGFNAERSGYFVFIALTILFAFQHCKLKILSLVLCLIVAGFLGVYSGINTVKNRIDEGVHDVAIFYQEGVIDTSLGVRLSFVLDTLEILKERPLLGAGVGSFPYIYAHRFNIDKKEPNFNGPHSTYSQVAFELGLTGLFLYLLFLYQLLRCIGRAPRAAKHLMQGLWLSFIVLGFAESGLALNAVAVSTMALMSLYLPKPERSETV